MLECPLVHGWLLDPFVALSDGSSGGGGNDEPMTTSAAIGSLTYNEVMDRVILGQEASLRLQQLHTQIEELRLEHPALFFSNDDTNFSDPISNNNYAAAAATNNLVAASQKYAALKRQEHEAQVQATAAHLMEQFLAESSHQLTLYGLEMLHSTLKEHELCVFFRNNHYGTITKHSDGLLYLLVTDLGYADTPSIVWEKLDVVDGDTEFCNSQFGVCHPGGGGGGGNSTPLSPPTTTTPATTTHPMQVETTTMTTTNMGMKMLPSSNQGDDDYRLALELSRYENQQSATPPPRNRRRDDADDRTLHDSSSKQPRPNNAAAPPSLSSLPAPTMVAIPGKATAATTQIHNTNASTTVSRIEVGIPVMNSSQINQQQQQQQLTSAHFKHETRFESSRQEAADRILALQLQQETPDNNETSTTLSQANNTIDTVCMGDHDDPRSLQLARQLQQEEDRQVASLAAANDRNRPAGNNSNYNTTTTTIAPPNRKTAAAAQTNVCAIM